MKLDRRLQPSERPGAPVVLLAVDLLVDVVVFPNPTFDLVPIAHIQPRSLAKLGSIETIVEWLLTTPVASSYPLRRAGGPFGVGTVRGDLQ